MAIKDYYTLLELPPCATQQEIKKAYRKLAQQYHPDKTNNEPFATARFAAIKEAHEILTNPAKKEYYLQQRWYDQSTGQRGKQGIVTPVTLLKQLLELDKYVAALDTYRMDKEGLYEYIVNIIQDENIEILNAFSDLAINKEVTQVVLNCSRVLSLPLVISLFARLARINNDPTTVDRIGQVLQLHYKTHRREKYRGWLLLLLAVLLCLLIFFISR